jgi:hypothetical protein
VNNKTGVITVADCPTPGSRTCLDFETKQHYYLTYKVRGVPLSRYIDPMSWRMRNVIILLP